MSKRNKLVDWENYLEYQGGKLIWKRITTNKVKVGDVAGTLSKLGYLHVGLKGALWPLHRVVWYLHKGSIPTGMQVDHINHDRTDNRIENLRLVNHTDNGRNQSKGCNNTSGVTGVSWNARRSKWHARVCHARKVVHVGYFEDIEVAAKAVKVKYLELGYHPNHGE